MIEYTKSVFNYTGGKHKLLPQLIPMLPTNIHTFYDLFGGGFSVGLNTPCVKRVYNDTCFDMYFCLVSMYNTRYEQFLNNVEYLIDAYKLAPDNLLGYTALRHDYSYNKRDNLAQARFYLLCCQSFNNMQQYNKNGDFTAPFGRRLLHSDEKLESFIMALQSKNTLFYNQDFSNFDSFDCEFDFVYLDPPYNNSTAKYNLSWTMQHEYNLYYFCDELNKRGIRFGLSNTVRNKGKLNHVLQEWMKKYNVHHFEMDYGNCNYHRISKEPSEEIFICNY